MGEGRGWLTVIGTIKEVKGSCSAGHKVEINLSSACIKRVASAGLFTTMSILM